MYHHEVYFMDNVKSLSRTEREKILKKWVGKETVKDIIEAQEDGITYHARCIKLDQASIVYFYDKFDYSCPYDLSALTHELFHAKCFLMDEHGMLPDLHNQEWEAYLLGHIVKDILLKIKKSKK